MNGARSALAIAILACATAAPAAPAPKNRVARGKYLVTISHCNDCHTPFKMGPNGPEPDMTRMLSGHPQDVKLPAPPAAQGPWLMAVYPNSAWSGPWGISYAANLTPDKTTGFGAPNLWTEELFIKAMRTGKHFGTSRPILPPMPWQNIAQMTDEDLRAMWAYLKTIPPIRNHVPDAVLAPPPPGSAGAAK